VASPTLLISKAVVLLVAMGLLVEMVHSAETAHLVVKDPLVAMVLLVEMGLSEAMHPLVEVINLATPSVEEAEAVEADPIGEMTTGGVTITKKKKRRILMPNIASKTAISINIKIKMINQNSLIEKLMITQDRAKIFSPMFLRRARSIMKIFLSRP